jgi:hypothetical protein
MPHPPSILPDPLRAPTMDEIERARSMYAEKFTVARCLAAGNMSHGTLYYWLDGGPRDDKGVALLPPIARRRQIAGKRRKPLAGSSVSLLARLTRTAERQALDIEQRLSRPAASGPERERDVRILAMLTRTLRDVVAMAPDGLAQRDAQDAEHDPVPDNIDEFRYELARRINAFVAARRAQKQMAEMSAAGDASAAQSENHTPAPDVARS